MFWIGIWIGLVVGVALGVAYQAWYGKPFKKPRLKPWARLFALKEPRRFELHLGKPGTDPKAIDHQIYPRPHAGGRPQLYDELETAVRTKMAQGDSYDVAWYAAVEDGKVPWAQDQIDLSHERDRLRRRMQRHEKAKTRKK